MSDPLNPTPEPGRVLPEAPESAPEYQAPAVIDLGALENVRSGGNKVPDDITGARTWWYQ
jgi:hypothetical protein